MCGAITDAMSSMFGGSQEPMAPPPTPQLPSAPKAVGTDEADAAKKKAEENEKKRRASMTNTQKTSNKITLSGFDKEDGASKLSGV